MEEMAHQVSAFLACQSRADLIRLREMDSPSFPFITLACKHNRPDLLNLLLEDDTSDGAVVVSRWCSMEQKDEGHNAVYHAIRSSNVELLHTLLGSVTPELSERLVSESYEEILLNNVLLSEEIHLFIQYKLLELRFFSKDDGALSATSTGDIQERIQLLVENIAQVNTYKEVDNHFLYTAKFIAQNIHILKNQLKSTYNILPWEEMEFCLVSFISAHIRPQELNLFYKSVLRKEKLLKELLKFASALQELEEHIRSTDVKKLKNPVRRNREDIVAAIIDRYPHLYTDYKEVRDVTSLHIMKTYLDAALLADTASRLGQLTIKRALQVTGEHLNNTLDSPKLSPAVSDLLLRSAPKETRDVLQDLRNSLSHPHLESENAVLYSNIQNDIKKIASVITDITNSKKVNKVKCLLTTLVNIDDVDEFREVADVFRNVCIADAQETEIVTRDQRKLVDLIKNIEDLTPYEEDLFNKIINELNQSNLNHRLTKEDYSFLNKLRLLSSSFYGNIKSDAKKISDMKHMVNKCALKNLMPQKNRMGIENHYLLADLLYKFYNSVSLRNKPEIAFELEFALFKIKFTGSLDKSDVKCIDDYRRQIILEESNKNKNVRGKCKSIKTNNGIIDEQLTLKLSELKNTVGTDRTGGQLHERLSAVYKGNTTDRFTVEALVLDIMSLLDTSKRVPNNTLYLDGDMPLLSGKCLRNHLAHGNALVDILPTDAWSTTLLNAVKLTESKDLLLNCKIGNVLKHNITQLRKKYEGGLVILDKQRELWKSLLDGNFETFTLGIAGGADICSRTLDLSSTLHQAARGPNIETIKFLAKQKIISTEVTNIDGHTALHIAAAYGRDVTVKFLVTEMRNDINQVDHAGKTPLHLASQNGHKKTVVTLLSLGAKTTIKDITGLSPMHSAVMNSYLDVVKILLEEGVAVDEKTLLGGLTPLHIAIRISNMEIMKYLLLNGADINAMTDIGASPLNVAACIGHLEVVNVLLEKGAHINLKTSNGYSPLLCAVEVNHNEIVETLLEKGAIVNNGDVVHNTTPFHMAVANGNEFIVDLLLQHKVNVNARRNDGTTPLLLAAWAGHADIVDLLLQNGALADSKDFKGLTALHHATFLGHTSVVQMLIHRGIDIHTQNTDQMTALHLAAHAGHQQVLDILLAAGANVHSADKDGLTALHHSARNGHEAISRALLKKGSNVNCKNSDSITPLIIATVKPCNEKTIQMLLKYGADVNGKGEHTALQSASFAGYTSMIEALLQGKPDVNAKDHYGNTALFLAVSGNHKTAVEILLKHGADVNHLDAKGSSVLCYAARNNNKELLDILIAKGADVNVGGGELLLTAIRAGHRHIVEALLKNDVDINIKREDGANLLYTVALSGDALIARALINRGIKVQDCLQDPSPLFIATILRHTEFVEVLLENGADINPADPNLSPLYHAIQLNNPDVVERLLHWGANSNIRDSNGRTPLELAVDNAQIQNTSILLQQIGDKINERGNDHWSLLHFAAKAGNLEVTKLLVDLGADLNAKNRHGSKPIHIAVGQGHRQILTLFLGLGMSIDDPGTAGCTLMHYAASGGQLTMAQHLMDKQVDINSTNSNGSMPIHCSAEQGHTEMVKFLLQSGAVYDATDNFGSTPVDLTKSRDIKEVLESIGKLFKAVKKNNILMVGTLVKDLEKYIDVKSSDNATLLHIASWKGFQEVCDILLESKANPNAVGKGGNAPLYYASKYSHPGIVQSLLKNGAAHNLKADNMKTPLDFATQKDIKYLLQIVALCFTKVRTCDVTVIEDITKIRDVEIIKAVMKARDDDGNTLVVAAMKYDFPNVDQLKQVSQVKVPDILNRVNLKLMDERYTEAIDILKKLLNDRIKILGDDNPGTLDIQYKIMLALYKQCKYFEAMAMLEDIYRKRIKDFGPHHPVSLETRSILAALLNRLGRNKESWDIFQEVMPRQQEVLGEGHDKLLRTKNNAGVTLLALGKLNEALCLYAQVYEKLNNTLGAFHLRTLGAQNNIAKVLHAQGKLQKALALYKTVYEVFENTLGCNHSETLLIRRDMATILMSQHKYDKALKDFQEILDIQKNVLGLKHQDTLHTQFIITRLYLDQNKMHDAVKFHKAGLDARNAVFGPNHPKFTKLDKDIESLEIYFKSKFGVELGYVAPCDFNLLNASYEGDRGKICNLIENGSDVNTADGEGRTALHFATTVEVTKLLLNSGADATAVSQKGNTPLHLATSRVCGQTVRLLLQNVKRIKPSAYHDFINAKTAVGGSTALHISAKKGAVDIVSCLLIHGACYNSRDRSENRTPLQCSSSTSVVSKLLRLAEEMFEMARRGGTVLPQGDERHLAAVMNSRDIERRTPLQLAVVHGNTATARLLTELLKTLN